MSDLFIPRSRRPRLPIRDRLVQFCLHLAFWSSVILTPLTLWVWLAWAIGALEVVR